MRLDLLTKLADALETQVPQNQFDLGAWQRLDAPCGFVGCAVGWGIHLGVFMGLRLDTTTNGYNPLALAFTRIIRCDGAGNDIDDVDGLPSEDWNNVASYLELDLADAAHLFDSDEYEQTYGGLTWNEYYDRNSHEPHDREFDTIKIETVVARIREFVGVHEGNSSAPAGWEEY